MRAVPVTEFGAAYVARNLDPLTAEELRIGSGQDSDMMTRTIVQNALYSRHSFVVYSDDGSLPCALVSFVPITARHLGVSFLTTSRCHRFVLLAMVRLMDGMIRDGLGGYNSAEILVPDGDDFAAARRIGKARCCKATRLPAAALDGRDIWRFHFDKEGHPCPDF